MNFGLHQMGKDTVHQGTVLLTCLLLKNVLFWQLFRNIRPWGYIAAKEDYDVLKKLVKELEDEATQVETGGIDIETASGNKYHINVKTMEMSMIGMAHI